MNQLLQLDQIELERCAPGDDRDEAVDVDEVVHQRYNRYVVVL